MRLWLPLSVWERGRKTARDPQVLLFANKTMMDEKGVALPATMDELRRLAAVGLDASPIGEILIERSIAGGVGALALPAAKGTMPLMGLFG